MITGSNIPDPGKGTRCKEAPRRHHTDTVLREEDLGGEPYALRGARTDRKGVDHTGLPTLQNDECHRLEVILVYK
jgi:hypothetical protein